MRPTWPMTWTRQAVLAALVAAGPLAACSDDAVDGETGGSPVDDVGALDSGGDAWGDSGDEPTGDQTGGAKDDAGASTGGGTTGTSDAGPTGDPDADPGSTDETGGETGDDTGDETGDDTVDETVDHPSEVDECFIDDDCWANLESPPDNPCAMCVVIAAPDAWTANDEGVCDDASACTSGDACLDGACVGVAKNCSDGNLCTVDTCDPVTGACTNAVSDIPCEDGDPCTAPDGCVDGVCQPGPPATCDDDNPCTLDTCVTGAGCIHQDADGAVCDDGSSCTTDDVCAGGACVGGEPLNCDDNDLCTIDSCDGVAGCNHSSIADLCTDTNPCTDEACDPASGCVFPFNDAPCDDQSLCTTGDQCFEGACLGALVPVDDANPCTDDTCDPATGPAHVANAVPCDDGDACTLGDQCADSACAAGAGVPECDDENLCTDDACEPAEGCVFTPNSAPCDDETACTSEDQCAGGACGGVAVDCDDGDACTSDWCDPVEGCKSDVIVSNFCRPDITVTYPLRGATIQGAGTPTITVTGSVTSGGGPITSFMINGVPTQVAGDGSFSRIVQTAVGGNTLVFEAVDAKDTPRRRVQAFHWAKGYNKPAPPKGGMADPGLGIFLSQEVIDDGDHSQPADDLATIFELVLAGFDIAGLVPSGALASVLGYDIYIKNLKDTKRSVSLQSGNGVLKMTATIEGVTGDVDAKAEWLPDASGDLTITKITIKADVEVNVVNHALDAQLKNVDVTLTGVDISIGWLVDWLIDLFVDGFVSDIEQNFESEMAAQLEPMLTDALSSLAFSTSFDMPSLDPAGGTVAIDLVTDFSAVDFTPAGGAFHLRAGAYAADKATAFDNSGAVRRLGCGTGLQQLILPKASNLELSLADDTFNLLLWSAWSGGLLEFDVPDSMLADVDLGEFGITDVSIHISGMLAPVISDCNPDQSLKIHIGDLRADASMSLLGTQMDVVMFASFTAGVELAIADGELGLALTELEELESEVTVVQEGLIGSEAVIAGMIDESLVPGLLDALGGGTLGGFPLPEIDLSGSLDGVPPGTGIAIDPEEVSRAGGNTIVSGDLK